jgi:hypothetical protein
MRSLVPAFLALALALPVSADPGVVASTVRGDPGLKSIEVLGFASDGILLVGDGRGSQVVAIMTGDTKPAKAISKKIEKFDASLAAELGATAADVEITDLAVNPASGRLYVAVRRKSDKSNVLLTLDGDGKIEEFSLKSVEHASVPLPKGEQSPISKITDVAWAGGKLLAAGYANEEFASKIFVAPGPLKHQAQGSLYSAETYHVSHGKWETRAPMSVILPFEEAGKTSVVGAFSCTPVVKYAVDALQPGAKVKGISMVELGSGNRPLDMIAYTKDGRARILMNTFRFHHDRAPFGPSPYWAAVMDAGLLEGQDAVNEKAARRLAGGKPANDRIRMVEEFHGVVQLDKLSEKEAVVLRQKGENFDLEPVALP